MTRANLQVAGGFRGHKARTTSGHTKSDGLRACPTLAKHLGHCRKELGEGAIAPNKKQSSGQGQTLEAFPNRLHTPVHRNLHPHACRNGATHAAPPRMCQDVSPHNRFLDVCPAARDPHCSWSLTECC